jgi:hypothetical protein
LRIVQLARFGERKSTMPSIKLTRDELAIADQLKAASDRLWGDIKRTERLTQEEVQQLLRELGRLGHALHVLLANRGVEPRHHKYMLDNRGASPTDPDFYAHLHPVEDLFKFLENTGANDDPPDVTMGGEFVFRAYSQRWGHDDQYEVVRTADGWRISFMGIGGHCDREGTPFLFRNLAQDGISYPESLGSHLADVWQAAADGATWEEVQRRIDELSDWVRVTENATPGSSRIEMVPSPSAPPNAYYSVFICYGQPDADFARDLERGLAKNGVPTRFFDRHAQPGEALHRFMWRGVNEQDRVILLCSREGLERSGLRNEIEQAFAKEARLGGSTVLIPVALDDWLFASDGDELRTRLTSRTVCRCSGRSADGAVAELLPALTRPTES